MTEEQDDSPAVQTHSASGKSTSVNDMVEGYLPENDDWIAKTVLDLEDPATIAALQQIGHLYPEVDELQPMIDDFVDTFVRGRTSVAGQSREEYKDIFSAAFGGNPGDDDAGKALAQAFGVDDDD